MSNVNNLVNTNLESSVGKQQSGFNLRGEITPARGE